MAKKIVLLLSCVFCLQFAVAQSMSDEQITQYVLTEQSRGTSQSTIANNLLQKGVTFDRLRKLKENYRVSSSSVSSASVTSSTTTTSAQMGDMQNVGVPSGDAWLYFDEYLLLEPRVFGHNIFNNQLLTFESSSNTPVPSDYVLGAGDQVIINIWGVSQSLIEQTISKEGKIIVDGVGPLFLAGKSVEDANKYVNDVLGKIYSESSINLTVGATRSIVVQVLGEVVTPGSYTLSAFSTAFNALYAAGGISDIGTLRSINVFRKGKNIATIDVYDYIFNGKTDGNIRLQDDDVISVGAYESIVKIAGKVKRPLGYEMKENEKLSTLLKYSGGFTGDAYTEKLRVVRKTGREYSLFTVDKKNMGEFALCDGDSIYVDSIIPRFSNRVEISGAVFFPGSYQFSEEINTVSELIEAAGGLREDAFLNRAILYHVNADKTREAEPFDLKALIDGVIADIELCKNDVLLIRSASEMRGEQTITIYGEVYVAGKYKYADNLTIEDAILRAGGLTNAASCARVDVSRRVYDPWALEEVEHKVETFSFKLKDGFVVDGDSAFVLKPFDEINVRRSPVFGRIDNVKITGEVNFSGQYPITSNDFKLSDLVKVAGGVNNNAYLRGANLLRKATKEELKQTKILKERSAIDLYEDALVSSREINLVMLDSLLKMKMVEEGVYMLAIDLEKAIENPGSKYDVVLRDGDVLTIPEYTSTVKIRGEVNYPTATNWQKGKSLNYYIKHAGGFGSKAKKNGVYVINMNGSVEKLSRSSKKAILPGSEIVVPSKKYRKKMSTGEIIAIGTSTVSLGTMIATFVRLVY